MKKILIIRLLSFMTLNSHAQTYSYDVNHDGDISLADVLCLVNKILGLPNPGEQQSSLTCPDSNHPHMIDLGLPSGTKWACCNVGADNPEDFGGYYARGETETRFTYDWFTYIHCDGTNDTCHDLGSDIAGIKYDVAHVKWDSKWCIPSDEQQDELKKYCSFEWTTINNINGGLFTGKNGASIFLPAAGYYHNSYLSYAGSYGSIWSSTQDPSNSSRAYGFYFYSDYAVTSYGPRDYGRSVRPVVRN